jgi:hypothetical protein
MRVAIRYSLMAAALVVAPSTASAALITTGVWEAVGSPTSQGVHFWDQESADCRDLDGRCNAAQVILGADGGLFYNPYDPADGRLEYLHDGSGNPVAFWFDTSVTALWTWEYFNSSLDQGRPGQSASGAITYNIAGEDDPDLQKYVGFVGQSVLDPKQFALFRQQIGGAPTRYYFAFEDRTDAGSDFDYNDSIMSLQVTSVPEPTTLVLLGTGVLGVVVRRFRHRS